MMTADPACDTVYISILGRPRIGVLKLFPTIEAFYQDAGVNAVVNRVGWDWLQNMHCSAWRWLVAGGGSLPDESLVAE